MVDIDSINCILLVTEIKARKIKKKKKKICIDFPSFMQKAYKVR